MLKTNRLGQLSFLFVALMAFGGLLVSSNAQAAGKLSVEKVEGAETIDVKKAKALFDKGVIFIDSRSQAAFDAGRIPGAESVPLSRKPSADEYEKVKKVLLELTPINEPAVMYCNGPKCPLSADMVEKALSWGYKTLYYFREGYPAWKKAGYAVE